jgi:hypothetical protein
MKLSEPQKAPFQTVHSARRLLGERDRRSGRMKWCSNRNADRPDQRMRRRRIDYRP